MRRIHHSENHFSAKALFWILFLVLILTAFAIYKQLNRQKNIDFSNQKINSETANLAAQNKELEQLIAYFNSSEFIEKEAREKLNMAKPGEKTLVITKEENTSLNNTMQNQSSTLIKWWQYFFGE